MNIDQVASEAGDLFVLPEAVTRLKECMDDHAASIDDVADVIAYDPALTTQLLKVANSALYRFPNQIETIPKALQVIGTRAAYDLALAYGVSHAFSEVDGMVVDLDKFWEQSVSCALLAKFLGEQKRFKEPEQLFVSGLLHNIGELVIIEMAPEKAKRCREYNQRVMPHELQMARLGFTYSALSARLIEQWGIPSKISKPLTMLHQTEQPAVEIEAQILQLAYILALDNVNSEVYSGYGNLKPHQHEILNLTMDDLEDALDITNLQCISVISLFNPSAFMLY